MERFKMVNANRIQEATFNINESVDSHIEMKFDQMVEKYGQTKMIVVCEVGDGCRVIDGNKVFKQLKKYGYEKILCYNLGELSDQYELGYRILMNYHSGRLDHLGVAELISKLCSNTNEINQMSNITGLPSVDVERYSNLLDFDWNDFLNKKIEVNQIDLFDIIEQEEKNV